MARKLLFTRTHSSVDDASELIGFNIRVPPIAIFPGWDVVTRYSGQASQGFTPAFKPSVVIVDVADDSETDVVKALPAHIGNVAQDLISNNAWVVIACSHGVYRTWVQKYVDSISPESYYGARMHVLIKPSAIIHSGGVREKLACGKNKLIPQDKIVEETVNSLCDSRFSGKPGFFVPKLYAEFESAARGKVAARLPDVKRLVPRKVYAADGLGLVKVEYDANPVAVERELYVGPASLIETLAARLSNKSVAARSGCSHLECARWVADVQSRAGDQGVYVPVRVLSPGQLESLARELW